MKSLLTLSALIILSTSGLFSQVANHVVISEVYGGGGNSGSTYTHDFVELYNPTPTPIDLTGWSVQYASATGATWQVTNLTGTIAGRGFYLIQQAQGAGGTTSLPAPDAIGTIPMSATAGKVALVRSTTALSGANPVSTLIVDFVGYGSTASAFEGTGPAPAPSNTNSIERKASGASTQQTMASGGSEEFAGNGWDSDNNASDFLSRLPQPQNSASPKEPSTAGDVLAGIGSASLSPSVLKADTGLTLALTVRGDALGTITKLRVLVPAIFTWSRDAADVHVAGGGVPTVQVEQDTVILTGVSLLQNDSLVLQLHRLAAPDTTLSLTIRVETAAGGDSTAAIASLPRLLVFGTPRSIGIVRANNASGVPVLKDQYVTIRGVVTVGNEFLGPAFLQEMAAGVSVFDAGFRSSRSVGDEVTMTGKVSQFNGLTQLEEVVVHEIHSTGNSVTPLVVSARDIRNDGAGGVEEYEGMLVRLNRVRVLNQNNEPITAWTVTGAGTNFKLVDETDTVTVRIDGDTDIPGASAPNGEFDLIGVVGQLKTGAPFIGDYQILPRSLADILAVGPTITSGPTESSITPTSLQVSWETADSALAFLRYGRTTTYELGQLQATAGTTTHIVTLQNLAPATIYQVRAFAVLGNDTISSENRVVSTASLGSSGEINVYFSKSTDASVARYGMANANTGLLGKIVDRIEAAQYSIDAALYSLSGSVGDSIARSLVRAQGRGVRVRIIVEKDNLTAGTGTTFNSIIGPAGIRWIADDFDAANGGAGLHHNKFFIFDHQGGLPERMWVWTGSWNPTDSGTYNDKQNVIEVQDAALAGAYTVEFNEMWGSESDTPDAALSRFGARKTDNTPHIFNINGVHLEAYFSPSDRTTSQITRTLGNAQHSIDVAAFTITRSDLAQTLVTKRDEGRAVRVILDDSTSIGTQYPFLVANGIGVRIDTTAGLLHHKYAVVDAQVSQGVPSQSVITGSHNWSAAAENSNNENTLIILDNRIANHYLQEFAARYREAGGGDIVVSAERVRGETPEEFKLKQNYPNPFNPTTNIEYSVGRNLFVRLSVYDVLGREIAILVNGDHDPGVFRIRWDASNLPNGVYYYRLHAGAYFETKKMLLTK